MSDTKDTIYIDVDEEITGIISKIQGSSKDIVALVLPKRAAVLQSIVNMKLLKRAQEQHKKKVVLITSEARILPLAGTAGLFVASNLTSKPYIPPLHKAGEIKSADDKDDALDPNTPISQVAQDAKFADSDDDIQIDNTPKTDEAATDAASGRKRKKDKKNKVPNFSKFRKKVIIIALVVILFLFSLIYGVFIAPKATVTLKAQTSELPLTLDFTADPDANSFDSTSKIVRASQQKDQKDNTEKVNSTGTKNKGDKAAGSVTMTAKKCGGNPFTAPHSVAAGTGLSSPSDVTYITQEGTSFTTTGATTDSQGCFIYPATNDTSITAQSPGENANTSNSSFGVAGRSDVSAQGSASGGSDKNVKVVTQSDVDKAKERIDGAPNTAHDEFIDSLKNAGYVPIEDSFKAKPGKYDVSPAVGAEGDQVTVSVTTTYTMLGLKKEDLQQLVKDQVSQSDEGKDKTILSDGIDQASFKISDSAGQISVAMNTQVVVGPALDQENIKNLIAGKKSGEAENILGQIDGVNEPKVDLSPFWVGKVPKKHSKITIEIQQADGSQIP